MFAEVLDSQYADHASINLRRFSSAVAAAPTRTMPRHFHHHGTSGGWPKASSGPRKSLCLMADQAQKIALHTTSRRQHTARHRPSRAPADGCDGGAGVRYAVVYKANRDPGPPPTCIMAVRILM